jgi:nucleotide-binding universal stress UspA family protein
MVVVPLDGSERAECALPVAASIAARAAVLLRLIHVHAADDAAFGTMDAAERYVRTQVDRLRDATAIVTGDVMRGEVLDALRHEGAAPMTAWVVMTSGGAGGERQGFGRVSAGLVSSMGSPIILCGPSMSASGGRPGDATGMRNIAIALDGSGDAEAAIPRAVRLARVHGARLTLLSVEPAEGGEMEAYLDALADRLDAPDLHVSRRRIRSRDTAGSLVRAASEENADAIAIGRGFLARDPAATAIVVAAKQPLLI